MPTVKELRQKFDVAILMRTPNHIYDTTVEFHKNEDIIVVEDVRSLDLETPYNRVIDTFMDTWSMDDSTW